MIEWFMIALVVGSLVGLLAGVSHLGARYRWHPEWQRKTLHVALGVAALSFPWLFATVWPVWVICGVGALILLALRRVPILRRRLGRTLHDVKRTSSGELLFTLAIVLLFALAHETPVAYVVPLAILTFADTAAALVGAYWGRHCFAIPDGRKSWEGVAAFAGMAVAVTLPLLAWLTALAWPQLLAVALIVGILTTLVEALAWHGQDNLLVPLTGYLALSFLPTQSPNLLLAAPAMLLGLALLFIPWMQQGQTHSVLTALFTCCILWLGGPLLWTLPLLALIFSSRIYRQRWPRNSQGRIEAMPLHYWLVG